MFNFKKWKLNLKNNKKRKIAIIGHMGSGKSSIGILLAKELNLDFYDSDTEIEKLENKKIRYIFESKGEKYFRKIEEKIIKEIYNKDSFVISLGGGSILSNKTQEIIKKRSISIFLKVDINTLFRRLKNSQKRPLLLNTDIKEKINFLDKERSSIYNKADIVIENINSKKLIINKIKDILNY